MSDQVPPVQVNVSTPEPSTVITLKEVYDEVRATSQTIDKHLGPLSDKVKDLDRDVEALKSAGFVTWAQLRWILAALVVPLSAVVAPLYIHP